MVCSNDNDSMYCTILAFFLVPIFILLFHITYYEYQIYTGKVVTGHELVDSFYNWKIRR